MRCRVILKASSVFNHSTYSDSSIAGKHVTSKEEIRSIKWNSWTGVLGVEVNGIWEKYSDTNDVNALDANYQHECVVTGDDFGLVKVFRFPTLKKGCH